MTISSTTRIAGPFIGTGVATVFPFTFKVFAAGDLQVVRLTVSTGLQATLVLNSDYTVSLNQNQDSNPGGSVTLTAGALAIGFTLTITSDIANLQPTDITNQGGFYPEVIEDALDRATIQIQQMADEVARSIKAPISDASPDMELPSASVRANTFLAFDANGKPTIIPAAGSGSPVGSTSASLVTYDPGLSGSAIRSVQSKLREYVSVKDFGATGDGTTNDVAALTAAFASGAKEFHFPAGTYNLGTIPKGTDATGIFNFVSQSGIRFVADGLVTFQVAYTNSGSESTDIVFRFASCNDISFSGQFSFNDPTNTSTVTLGVTALSFQPNCSRVNIEWLQFTNMLSGVATIGTPNTTNVSDFRIGMIVATNVMYPLSWRNADGIEASLVCTNCQREYFLYACRNAKLTVNAINPSVVKYATIASYGTAYSSVATENIEIDHCVRFSGPPDRAALQIASLPATAAGAVAGFRNMKIKVHVIATSNWTFNAIGAVSIRADVDSGAPITSNADISCVPKDCTFDVLNDGRLSHDMYCAYSAVSGQPKARATWATRNKVNNDFLRCFHNVKVYSWTPALANGWAVGNGTASGAFYVDEGRMTLTVWCRIAFGSTSTFGGGQPFEVTIPNLDSLGYSQTSQMTIGTVITGQALGVANIHDNDVGATGYYTGIVARAGNGLQVWGLNGTDGNGRILDTNPFTWANGDVINITATMPMTFATETTP